MNEPKVNIQGTLQEDDALEIDMGPVGDRAWWEVPLPQCPDCGEDLVWFEAGYVPGTRKCLGKPIDEEGRYDLRNGCGSFFNIDTRNGNAILVREKFY